jgi:hypothetical protein
MTLKLKGMGDDGYWEGSILEACCGETKKFARWSYADGRKQRKGQKLYRFTLKRSYSLVFIPVGDTCPYCGSSIEEVK